MYLFLKKMININSYINEKLKISKDIKIGDDTIVTYIMRLIDIDNEKTMVRIKNIISDWVYRYNVLQIKFLYDLKSEKYFRINNKKIIDNDIISTVSTYTFSNFLTQFNKYFGKKRIEQDANCLLSLDNEHIEIYGNKDALSINTLDYSFIIVKEDN